MFYELDMAKVEQRRLQIDRQSQEKAEHEAMMTLLEGANLVRFLWPWSQAGEWRKEVWYHRNFTKRPFVCLKVMFNQPCPACDYVEELYKEEKKKEAYNKKTQARFFSNVLDLKKNDGKVYVLGFGVKIERPLTKAIKPPPGQEQFGKGNITHPEKGFDILINKKSLNPQDKSQVEYGVEIANYPTPVPNWQSLVGKLHNLDEIPIKSILKYDEILSLVRGTPAPAQAVPAFQTPGLQQFGGAPPAAQVGPVNTGFEPPQMPPQFGQLPVQQAMPASTAQQFSSQQAVAPAADALQQALARMKAAGAPAK